MGGGPIDQEEDQSSLPDLPPSTVESVTAPVHEHRQETHATFPQAKSAEVSRPGINQTEQEHPVLSTMAAGAIVGGMAGSMLGVGSLFGSTTGAFIAASVASRDDSVGASARRSALVLKSNVKTGFAKAVDRLNQEELGREFTMKVSDALQTLVEKSEQYKVAERVETAASTVYQKTEPKVRVLLDKVAEADTNQYLPKALEVLRKVDSATGFTRSIDAVKREMKV